METIIETQIKNATAEKPITSTRLIEIVRLETGETITARRVRLIVDKLRKDKKIPILSSRDGKSGGYYLCRSVAEFEDFEAEVRNHAIRELTTIKEIKCSYFGQAQGELMLI